jgi:hypothetical protein
MSKVEHLSDGKRITRDEFGRFEKVELDSSTARAMAKARAPNVSRDTTSTTLLEEAGYSDLAQAPEHLRLLAQIASSRRSGAVPALRDFRKLTASASEPAAVADNRREVELVGGSDSFITVNGVMYSKLSPRGVSELVRMIKDEDLLAGG